jgi:CheY-like chemotaxis protein
VLHIDDDDTTRRLVQRALAPRADIKFASASRGTLGVEIARIYQPAVVLLDMQLPDVNVGEVLHRLRNDPRTSTIPVIILSGDFAHGLHQELLEIGVAAHLTKPLDVRALLDTIDAVIVEGNPSPPSPRNQGWLLSLLSPEGVTASVFLGRILHDALVAMSRAIELPLSVFDSLCVL